MSDDEERQQMSPLSRMNAPLVPPGKKKKRKPAPPAQPEPEPEPEPEAPPAATHVGFNAVGVDSPPPPQSVEQMLRGRFDPTAFSSDEDSNASRSSSSSSSGGSDDGGGRAMQNSNPLHAAMASTSDDDGGDDSDGDPVLELEVEEGEAPSLQVEEVSPGREPRSWSADSSPSPVQQTIERTGNLTPLSPSELTQMFKAAYGRPEAPASTPPSRPVAKRAVPAMGATWTDPAAARSVAASPAAARRSMSPTSRLSAPIASPSRTQADVEFSRGKQASGKADWSKAVAAYERYRELVTPQHSRYVQALADLGGCYAQLGQFSQAEDTIQECIQHLGGADGSMTPKDAQMLRTVELTLSIVRSRQRLGREPDSSSWRRSLESDLDSLLPGESPEPMRMRVAAVETSPLAKSVSAEDPEPEDAREQAQAQSPSSDGGSVRVEYSTNSEGQFLAAATLIGRMAEQATAPQEPEPEQPASPTMKDLERIQTSLLEQVDKVESKVEKLQLQEVDLLRDTINRSIDSPMHADIERLESRLQAERERSEILEDEKFVAAEVAAEAVAFSASALAAAAAAHEKEATMQLAWTEEDDADIPEYLAKWREARGDIDIATGVLSTTSLRYLGLMSRFSMAQAKQHLAAQRWEIACKQLEESAELGRFFQIQHHRAQRAWYTWVMAVRAKNDGDRDVPLSQVQKAEEEMSRLNGLVANLLAETDRTAAHMQDQRQEHVMLLSEHADLRDQNLMLKMGKQKAVLDSKQTVNHVLLSRVFISWFKIVAVRKATNLGRTAATQAYAIEAAQDAQAQTITQFRLAMEEVQSHMAPIVEERDAALALAEEEASRAAAAEANVEQTSMILEEAEHKLQTMGLQVRSAHEQLRLMELEHKVVPMQELEAIRAEVVRLEETYKAATAHGISEATIRGEARMEEVRAGADAAVLSLRRALADAQSSAVSSSTAFYENEIQGLQTRLERECKERAMSERSHAASQAQWEARTLRAEQELENERSGRRIAEASSAQLAAASAGLIPSQKNLEEEVERLATTVVRTQSGHDAVKKELSSADVRCHELELRLEAEIRARTATEALLEDTKANLGRTQSRYEETQKGLSTAEVRVHELELRLEAETRARTATEASLAEMTRAKQLVEDKIVGATLRLERETLLRTEEKSTHEKISKALTDQLTQVTSELEAELTQVKTDAKTQIDDVTMAAAQLMHEQEQLEELSVTTALQLEAEQDAHSRAQQDLHRLRQEAQLATETQATLEAALAKYDNELAIELTFRSKAERSLSLAVDRMNQRRHEEMVGSVFYSWARRAASKSWMRKRQVRVRGLAGENAQARAFAAWLGATVWKARAEQLMGRAMDRMSASITRKSLDAWVEATTENSHRTHTIARAARLFNRRVQSTAFIGWAEVTADTYRLVHVATKVIATLRSSRLLRIITEWRSWAVYEKSTRTEAEIMKLRSEHTVQAAARAAAEARAAKAEAAIEREKAARTRRVELRRCVQVHSPIIFAAQHLSLAWYCPVRAVCFLTSLAAAFGFCREIRAAMVVQRWYRRWLQQKLAANDDLYAFLRAQRITAHPHPHPEHSNIAPLSQPFFV
jgi:hypothetical protein